MMGFLALTHPTRFRWNLYSGSRLSEIQEPHPQPPPRKRGGDYDVFHPSAYRYINL